MQARGGFFSATTQGKPSSSSSFSSSSTKKKKKKKSSRFQLSPSAHPDVELLVHQGTDLVNREPVEVEKEEGKKMESRR